MLESLFDKVTGPRPAALLKKRLQHRRFLWICEMFKNTFFIQHLLLPVGQLLRWNQPFVAYFAIVLYCFFHYGISTLQLFIRIYHYQNSWYKVSWYDVSIFQFQFILAWCWLMLHCFMSYLKQRFYMIYYSSWNFHIHPSNKIKKWISPCYQLYCDH